MAELCTKFYLFAQLVVVRQMYQLTFNIIRLSCRTTAPKLSMAIAEGTPEPNIRRKCHFADL